MSGEEEVKAKGEEVAENKSQRIPTREEINRMRKLEAAQLAEYKRRVRESVELKRLQVEELELNIRYYHVRQEHKKIEVLIQEEEAKEQAEMQKARAAAERKANKLEVVKTGKPRTEEEIEKAKAEVQ